MDRPVCTVKGMSTKASDRSPRERLLSAANELFYEEGVHTVGIDRVLKHAGVAKASLYSTFGSKEELIRAYLEARLEKRKQRYAQRFARCTTARERILAVFDLLGESFIESGFRGCAFQRASAEAPAAGVRDVVHAARDFARSTFVELAREAGAADPDALAKQLVVLYDGATIAAQLDRDTGAATTARSMAVALLDAALVTAER